MIIDRGAGTPLVLIPGIQGRWEWMAPTVDALASRVRVLTGSLPGDTGATHTIDPALGFDSYTGWIDALLDRTGVARASICGVSFGGWIALHYAAARPDRVTSLTLASTPAPRWRPGCRVEWYLRAPRLLSPVFALTSPVRLYPEIAVAFPRLADRARFAGGHLYRVTRHAMSPVQMAERMRLAATVDFAADCERVRAPVQVVTGESGLDRVVAVESTRAYLDAIPGARYHEIERTGHMGLVTRPERFAGVVADFASDAAAPAAVPAAAHA